MPQGRRLIGFDKNYSTPKTKPGASAPGSSTTAVTFVGSMSLNYFFGAIGVNCALVPFVAELRFCRQILFLARQDLRARAGAAPALLQWPLPCRRPSVRAAMPDCCSPPTYIPVRLFAPVRRRAAARTRRLDQVRSSVAVTERRSSWCLCRHWTGPQSAERAILRDQHVAELFLRPHSRCAVT